MLSQLPQTIRGHYGLTFRILLAWLVQLQILLQRFMHLHLYTKFKLSVDHIKDILRGIERSDQFFIKAPVYI